MDGVIRDMFAQHHFSIGVEDLFTQIETAHQDGVSTRSFVGSFEVLRYQEHKVPF